MKPNTPVLTFILMALLLLASACQPAEPTAAPASPLTGTLSELQGKVDGKKNSQEQFQPITAGTILAVSDQVQTGEDGHVRIDLSSGTIVRLVPSTLFTLASNEETTGGLATKLKLEIGRIFIILKGGSMEVETPSGVASVLGSYMMVSVDPQTLDVFVTCLEGNCHAGNPAGAVDFTGGQKTVLFHSNPNAPKVEDMSEQDFQDWLDENPGTENLVQTTQAQNQKPTPQPTPTLVTIVPATEVPSASVVCLNIIQPPNDAALPFNGPVTFQWEAQAGATQYTVTFHSPNGQSQPFNTSATELTRFMDTLLDGGAYQWDVTALDGSGSAICTTQSSFTKPSSHVEDVAPPEKEPGNAPRCTPADAQWNDPNARCYCDPNSNENGSLPGYCQGLGLPNQFLP